MELLADSWLIVFSKAKSFRFCAPSRETLKQRLRYTTQTEVAFDCFLLAYLRRLQPHDLFAKLMKDLDRPAIAPNRSTYRIRTKSYAKACPTFRANA